MGHLKDLEISKYKRESKGRMPIKIIVLFLLIVVLFGFLNIKSVKIYNENTISLFDIAYSGIFLYIFSVSKLSFLATFICKFP